MSRVSFPKGPDGHTVICGPVNGNNIQAFMWVPGLEADEE
jgi:hypothetical protein